MAKKVFVQTISDNTKYIEWMIEHGMYIVKKSSASFLADILADVCNILAVTPEGDPRYFDVWGHKISDGKTLKTVNNCTIAEFTKEKELYVFGITPIAVPSRVMALVGKDYVMDLSSFVKSEMDKALLSHFIHGCSKEKCYKEAMKELFPGQVGRAIEKKPDLVYTHLKQLSLFGEHEVPFPPLENPKFKFIDLFAGIGGFHQAMEQLGGKCVFASEWDNDAKNTYEKNYGIRPFGDITKIDEKNIPPHDVLCAGFPCQPFSKAGQQKGFEDETKGTLFFDIERILKHHKTKYIVLENVRNLVAHDKGNTWKTIHSHLVKLGYRLTPEPLIVSPHYFGIPQLRERVVVLGVYDPKNAHKPLEVVLPEPMDKSECRLDDVLEPNNNEPVYKIDKNEERIINIWDEFYQGIKEKVIGFPIWMDWFKNPPPEISEDMPEWKHSFILKNNALYQNNKEFIDGWLARYNNLVDFTPTMRKMEWQCGTHVKSAWEAFIQMRPSGLRIKRPTCFPALVAIVQMPVIGKYRRRMTVREAARLQSFDDKFIPCDNMHQAYKQFGNAVNVTVIRECARRLFDVCS